MTVIDADAHVIENESAWDYMLESERQFRPRIVGATPRAFPPAEKTGAEALRERLSNSLSAWNDSVAAEAEAEDKALAR